MNEFGVRLSTMKLRHFALKIIKKSRLFLAILIIFAAILISLFRGLTPWAKQYKQDVEQHLSSLIGQPVSIKTMETSWYWFEPVLKLNQVEISSGPRQILTLNKLLVGIDLFNSLLSWRIQPGILYIDKAHLNLLQHNKQWSIEGLKKTQGTVNVDLASQLPALQWLLSQKKIIIKHVSAKIHLSDGAALLIDDINFTAVNSFGHYRLKGASDVLQDKQLTHLAVIADLKIDSKALSQISGQVYLSMQHVVAKQIQWFLPKLNYTLKAGEANIELWSTIKKGQVDSVQSILNLQDVSFNELNHSKTFSLPTLQANLAWRTTAHGWELSADKINVTLEKDQWPENKLFLSYNRDLDAYHVYVKTLPLQQILYTGIGLPKVLSPLIERRLHGLLEDTQLTIKAKNIDYLLTRFNQLTWQGDKHLPSVRQLSGVLHWEPTQGHLELESENTTIIAKGIAHETFQQLNAALEWKTLSDGLRVSLERFILIHPDLLISARGVVDGPTLSSLDNLRFSAEFSGQNAERWIAYIPAKYLKPKFNDWLKQDIQAVKKFSGQIQTYGPLAKFPFDAPDSGEFLINASVSGATLRFNKQWPINTDVSATITVNKRLFEADITQGFLNNIALNEANLRVDDIGLGRENLLIHGTVKAPGEQVKAYVFASPLRVPLAKFKNVAINNQLALDLSLEVPLNPYSERVLAKGQLTFDNNQLIFQTDKPPVSDKSRVTRAHKTDKASGIRVDDLTGVLYFTEQGTSASELQALLAGKPLQLSIQPRPNNQPGTNIHIKTSTSVDWLSHHFSSPSSTLMKGNFNVSGVLTMASDVNAHDKLHLVTSGQGIALNLPAPLGKTASKLAPITLDVEFNVNDTTRLQFNYDNRMHGVFSLPNSTDKALQGQLILGNSKAKLTNAPGISVSGTLSKFDVDAWQKTWSTLSDNKTELTANPLHNIDLMFGEITLFGKPYPNVAFHASKLNQHEWSVLLKQDAIDANLRYQLATNSWAGHINYLAISDTSWLKHGDKVKQSTLTPKVIPNLDLVIDSFKLGTVDVGTVAFKSVSHDSVWSLEQGSIKTPDYQLIMQGDWTKTDRHSNTELRANLQISNLANALQRFNITPVVEAKRGNLEFNGGWTSSLDDFSLQKSYGQLTMSLKDGRITHLSPETEEKIGLGKLLSIVSLQTIPRRLKLDFTDLSENGYSFDIYSGNFALNNGVMTTTDSYIDGPVAYASIKGGLDLVKRLYDIDLRVTPYITAWMPVVATIAGGPVAGIATWVASKIINKGMQKISGYTYKVSGPWDNPVVQQVKIYHKKKA